MSLVVDQNSLYAASKGKSNTVNAEPGQGASATEDDATGGSALARNLLRAGLPKTYQGTVYIDAPNVCKMPGPPAPFVPTPLPNIGKLEKDLNKAGFKKVKVHMNEPKKPSAKEIGAKAFAGGGKVYFTPGAATPGKELMRHEVTHALQQGAAKKNVLP